jgi:hypothetical protein
MELRKFKTLKPVLQGGKIVPAGEAIELNPELDSTGHLVHTKHITPVLAEPRPPKQQQSQQPPPPPAPVEQTPVEQAPPPAPAKSAAPVAPAKQAGSTAHK